MKNIYRTKKRRIINLSLCAFFVFAAINLFFVSSCSRQNAAQNQLVIAVSIPPQAWFVSQIAGEKTHNRSLHALVLVPPGQNPHNFEPSPRQIQGLVSASAWILSGSEFEIGLKPKISSLFPNLKIVDGTSGVQFRMMEEHEHDCDDHAHDGSSLEIDRHTWLGREPAKILSAHIRDTLCALDENNKEHYNENYEKLILLIDEVFDELKIDLLPLMGKNVYVYHPSFGYFFDEFGMFQEAVETGGKEPTPRELNNLILKLKNDNAAVLFVQTQFPTSAARSLAASTGVSLIALDPLAQDWLTNIKFMGQTLKNVIK
ncbi:MAG: zinc ABC transporter substrate-binding protein [Treponema sp.]|nr:zinc ABC transporter substrate-binding protein [Treponema sp.]MCL2251973.1 zinc ABC transporter substrate-binding protein [Treponema sp.]